MKTRTTVLALAGMLAFAAPLSAERPADGVAPDGRWHAWLGCWEPVRSPDAPATATTPPTVCVVPSGATEGVEFVTIVDGRIAERKTVQASERQPLQVGNCEGWERVFWSEDGQRLYRSSEQNCPGQVTRKATGVMAITDDGEWLQVEGIASAGEGGVRLMKYRPVTQDGDIPAEIRVALRQWNEAAAAGRLAAAGVVSLEDVVEASSHLDAPVVEAWLFERRPELRVDADRLRKLAEAGVSERVIDLVVALSYPDVFAINTDTRSSAKREQDRDYGRARPFHPSGRIFGWDPFYDPWFDGWMYSPYGLGYGYGYGYGYNRGYYGSRYGYGGYYGSPIVIVPREPSDGGRASEGRGRAVKGRGYVGPRSGSTGTSSGPRASTGSSGGSSSGDSGSTGRKAKPRN